MSDTGNQGAGAGTGAPAGAATGIGQGAAGTPPPASGQSVDFSTFIPADIKDHPSLKSYDLKTPDGLGKVFKSLVSAQSMIGGDKFVVPKGANDNPEAWSRAYDLLGRPKDPKEYQFPKDYKGSADPAVKEVEDKFRKFSHENGYSQKQFQGLHAFLDTLGAEGRTKHQAMMQQRHERAVEALRKEWGEQYDSRVALAGKVLKAFGGPGPETKEFFARYGNEPVMVRVLAEVGKRMDESALISGDKPDLDTGPAEAKSKRADIMTNKDNPLNEAWKNKKHPRHQEAMDEIARLSRIIVGKDEVVYQ